MPSSTNISDLLAQARGGNNESREALFRELHEQMRNSARHLMKHERSSHTLQATALVNEACLKLMAEGIVDSADNRRQLFFAAIRSMRQILIDHARGRATAKRGADMQRHPIDIVLENFENQHQLSYPALEEALEKLREASPRQSEVLNLRFFGGLTIAETAEMMGCSVGTVESDWRFARARLLVWLKQG